MSRNEAQWLGVATYLWICCSLSGYVASSGYLQRLPPAKPLSGGLLQPLARRRVGPCCSFTERDPQRMNPNLSIAQVLTALERRSPITRSGRPPTPSVVGRRGCEPAVDPEQAGRAPHPAEGRLRAVRSYNSGPGDQRTAHRAVAESGSTLQRLRRSSPPPSPKAASTSSRKAGRYMRRSIRAALASEPPRCFRPRK